VSAFANLRTCTTARPGQLCAKFGSDAFTRSAPCHLLRLFKMPRLLAEGTPHRLSKSLSRCLDIPRLKVRCVACRTVASTQKLENIFVSAEAYEATQSFENDGVNAGLLRTCTLNYGASRQRIPIS
jgi:hypothetical protein